MLVFLFLAGWKVILQLLIQFTTPWLMIFYILSIFRCSRFECWVFWCFYGGEMLMKNYEGFGGIFELREEFVLRIWVRGGCNSSLWVFFTGNLSQENLSLWNPFLGIPWIYFFRVIFKRLGNSFGFFWFLWFLIFLYIFLIWSIKRNAKPWLILKNTFPRNYFPENLFSRIIFYMIFFPKKL